MKHTSAIALLLGCALLSACGQKHSAEAFVRQNLKDPDSAKFGEFYFNPETKKGCMTVNAKNSMGGYTGDQQVVLSKGDNGWSWGGSYEQSHEQCREGANRRD